MRNVTEDVKKIVKFVQENCEKVGARFGKTAQQNRLTLNMLVDIFVGKVHACNEKAFCNCESCMMSYADVFIFHVARTENGLMWAIVFFLSGSKSAKVQTGMFGMGGAYSRHNADRLFKKLVLDNILVEDLYVTNNGQTVVYISAGSKAMAVLSGHMQVT